MANRIKSTLKIAEFEAKESRLFFLHTQKTNLDFVPASNTLFFTRGNEDKRAWESLLINDLIFTVPYASPLKSFCLKVVGKSIRCEEANNKPFLVYVECLGSLKHRNLNSELFFSHHLLSSPPRSIFTKYFERALVFKDKSKPKTLEPFFQTENYKINVAQTISDLFYVTEIATLHPFGIRKALVTLIATRNGKRCGALLADYSIDSNKSHRSQWRVYGGQFLWIKERALKIQRLYTKPHQWKIQDALITCMLKIAPFIIDGPLSVVEAISYEYHSLASKFGFNIVLPRRMEGSFYYWKPYSVPGSIKYRGNPVTPKHNEIKSILRQRDRYKYYAISVRSSKLSLSVEKRAWAIKHKFAGKWQSLRPGDLVFFVNENYSIIAYGIVSATANRKVRGLEKYPLWIDFDEGITSNINYDLKEIATEAWFTKSVSGAISVLPNSFGAKIKLHIDNQLKEGKMWVEPNPYLLRETSFELVHKQIFPGRGTPMKICVA